MVKYYTRPCNFFFRKSSEKHIKEKSLIPLNGNRNILFDTIEVITRKSSKKYKIDYLPSKNKHLKKKINKDLKIIKSKMKFKNLNFKKQPLIMGIINITPDSFSDGGKYLKKSKALTHAKLLISQGCSIIDIGGESTRPGAKEVDRKIEWKRVSSVLKKLKSLKYFTSLDTRKSDVMEKGIRYKVDLINDVSGFNHDKNTIKILKKTNIPIVINHMIGTPENMQKKPKYKNVILDIYDFFEKKIAYLRSIGIKHNNIILDPGIGFGKNLKHNITIINKISIFHSLGFPILLGTSRKRFIKDLAGKNDTKQRLGGTISSIIYAMTQGVQIFRVHDVNEVNQSIKVFKSLIFK